MRPGVEIDVRREPIGTVAIISPWNFPTATASWKIAPALCYGNAVVWKPANITPASAVALTEIINRQEDEFRGLEGLKDITSRAETGRARVTLEFGVDQDMDKVRNSRKNRFSILSTSGGGYPRPVGISSVRTVIQNSPARQEEAWRSPASSHDRRALMALTAM